MEGIDDEKDYEYEEDDERWPLIWRLFKEET